MKIQAALFVSIISLLSGCGKHGHSEEHDHAHASDHAEHKHEHVAPHGGTAVVLGEEAYHLELVRDASTGTLQAFVLDGEMERFIRCATPSFQVVATVGGEKRILDFLAVADAATGEKVGDSALFEAKAQWLKTTAEFDGVLTSLTIRGTEFKAVEFNFPRGNEH